MESKMSGVVASVNGRNGIVTLLSSDVTGALGFTPYNNSNPNNYIDAAGAPVQSVVGDTGAVTAAQIASAIGTLVSRNQSVSSVTATVGTTLSAAQMTGGMILRSGPTVAFTDTTDTAANLQAAYNADDTQIGSSFIMIVANATANTLTMAAGTAVTLAGNTVIEPNNSRIYLGVFTNVTSGSQALTLTGIMSGGL
jgi:hypothetical protein